VTTADFIKHYRRLADRAVSEPLKITKNDHHRFVVLSAEEYERLKRRARCVIGAADLSDAEIALIAQAEQARPDEELKDWHR